MLPHLFGHSFICEIRIFAGLPLTSSNVGICEMFEEKLKKEHRNQTNITYGIKDLFAWIDSLGDMGALVYVLPLPLASDLFLKSFLL